MVYIENWQRDIALQPNNTFTRLGQSLRASKRLAYPPRFVDANKYSDQSACHFSPQRNHQQRKTAVVSWASFTNHLHPFHNSVIRLTQPGFVSIQNMDFLYLTN
jgi:hypothetical protein